MARTTDTIISDGLRVGSNIVVTSMFFSSTLTVGSSRKLDFARLRSATSDVLVDHSDDVVSRSQLARVVVGGNRRNEVSEEQR